MLTIVLGAPGSGKTSVVGPVRSLLPDHSVLDWDDHFAAVASLVGRDVRRSPDLWAPYAELIRSIVTGLGELPIVLFTVCTPDELSGWPQGRWLLLDCDDAERRRRLAARSTAEVTESLGDAAAYRSLDMPVVDTTGRTVESVAELVADFCRALG